MQYALSIFEKMNYQEFEKTFIEILNKHAPMKKKLVSGNQVPYMTKTLRKAIMRKSEWETKYFKLKTNDTLKAYKNRNITGADYTRKKEKNPLKIWICHLLLTIKNFESSETII